MKYTFSNDLILGHYEMDTEHAEIVILLNKFIEAVDDHVTLPEIGKILENVIEYVAMHFEHEEALMIESNFKGYAEHKKHHGEFVDVFKGFLNEIKEDGITTKAMMGKMHVQAMDLLVLHVKSDDKILARYLKSTKLLNAMKIGVKL